MSEKKQDVEKKYSLSQDEEKKLTGLLNDLVKVSSKKTNLKNSENDKFPSFSESVVDWGTLFMEVIAKIAKDDKMAVVLKDYMKGKVKSYNKSKFKSGKSELSKWIFNNFNKKINKLVTGKKQVEKSFTLKMFYKRCPHISIKLSSSLSDKSNTFHFEGISCPLYFNEAELYLPVDFIKRHSTLAYACRVKLWIHIDRNHASIIKGDHVDKNESRKKMIRKCISRLTDIGVSVQNKTVLSHMKMKYVSSNTLFSTVQLSILK